MSSILSSPISTGLASVVTANLAQLQKPDIPWWFWVVMGSAFVILLWMLFNRPKENEEEVKEEKVDTVTHPEPEQSEAQQAVFTLAEEDIETETPVEELSLEEEVEPPSPFLDIEVNEEEIEQAIPFEDYRIPADDLTMIDGITAKTSKLLAQADVHTYEQLANTDVEKLQVILATAGIFLTDPSSWPVQARMAADGKWDELRQFQNENRND